MAKISRGAGNGTGFAVALLVATIGGMMVYSALKGVSITDVFAGEGGGDPLDPHGSSGGVSAGGSGGGATTGPIGSVGGIIKNGQYPLAVKGKIIGTPHVGTHTMGNWQSDNAVDIEVPRGTPVLAVSTGIVTKVSIAPEGGRISGSSVTISGPGGSFFYTHLSSVSVRVGTPVVPGKVIGASGVANGVPHLHFATMLGDPRKYTGS